MQHLQKDSVIEKIFYYSFSLQSLLSFLCLRVPTNVQHDGENNFLLKHKYDASSIENSDGFEIHLTNLCWKSFYAFSCRSQAPAPFSPSHPSFMVSVSKRCLHLIRASMSITPVLKNTLKEPWNKEEEEGKWVRGKQKEREIESKKKYNKVL